MCRLGKNRSCELSQRQASISQTPPPAGIRRLQLLVNLRSQEAVQFILWSEIIPVYFHSHSIALQVARVQDFYFTFY